MGEDNPDRTILYEEVARINTERGTDVTVEGILEIWGKKDTKVVTWSLGRGVLAAALGLIAALAIGTATSSQVGDEGGRAFLLTIGSIAIVGFLLVLRAEWRSQRDEHRYVRAIDEVIRRVEARHDAREQGQAE